MGRTTVSGVQTHCHLSGWGCRRGDPVDDGDGYLERGSAVVVGPSFLGVGHVGDEDLRIHQQWDAQWEWL